MNEKETVVRAFLAGWSGDDARKLADFFTEDAVVWNDMRTTVQGSKAIHEHFKAQLSVLTDGAIETTQVAISGNTVFTERIDRMKVAGVPIELPVAGVFEVNDAGKLTAWRDYFDLNTVMTQLTAAGIGGDPSASIPEAPAT
jgi:limonene-1,2-epoxide hydrolase